AGRAARSLSERRDLSLKAASSRGTPERKRANEANLATEAVALQLVDAMTVSDTIAAISTPPGEGAIALVRVSGANAIEIADEIFRGKEEPSRFDSHVQHLGEIVGAEDQLID